MPKEALRFARPVALKVKPQKVDEFLSIRRKKIIPRLRRERGLRRIYLLRSPDSPGEFVSLTLWNSQKDAENFEKSGGYKEHIKRVKHLLKEEPSVTKFRVEAHEVGQLFASSSKKTAKKPRRRPVKK